jgi:hypothetical protein
VTASRWIHARAPLRINDIGGWTDTSASPGLEAEAVT